MKIFNLDLSGHSHRVRLMASLLNLNPTVVHVDLMNGAHKQPEYLSINPFGQVPAIQDGDVTLFDSNAILVFLATKYDESGTWYPRNALEASQVQIWLSKASNELANSVAAARLVTVFNAGFDHQALLEKSATFLSIVNKHLDGKDWFVSNNPTIADVAMYSYIAHAPEGGIDLGEYTNIVSWINRIEELPGFIPMQSTETEAKLALTA